MIRAVEFTPTARDNERAKAQLDLQLFDGKHFVDQILMNPSARRQAFYGQVAAGMVLCFVVAGNAVAYGNILN
jgi:hypothetical protein